jgi:hypothetical protein
MCGGFIAKEKEIDQANHLFDGQAAEVGEALEALLEDFSCRTP